MVIAVAVSTGLLAGCEVANRFLEATVVNNTDQYLRIMVGNELTGYVRAQDTEVVTIGGSGGCDYDVTAVAEDGTLVAENPGTVCDGDTWVIEPTDLVPVEDAGAAPTPSP